MRGKGGLRPAFFFFRRGTQGGTADHDEIPSRRSRRPCSPAPGAAAAQGVALFGDARLGLGYNIDNDGGVHRRGRRHDLRAVSRVRFGVNMTGESDSGIVFGAESAPTNAEGGEGGEIRPVRGQRLRLRRLRHAELRRHRRRRRAVCRRPARGRPHLTRLRRTRPRSSPTAAASATTIWPSPRTRRRARRSATTSTSPASASRSPPTATSTTSASAPAGPAISARAASASGSATTTIPLRHVGDPSLHRRRGGNPILSRATPIETVELRRRAVVGGARRRARGLQRQRHLHHRRQRGAASELRDPRRRPRRRHRMPGRSTSTTARSSSVGRPRMNSTATTATALGAATISAAAPSVNGRHRRADL